MLTFHITYPCCPLLRLHNQTQDYCVRPSSSIQTLRRVIQKEEEEEEVLSVDNFGQRSRATQLDDWTVSQPARSSQLALVSYAECVYRGQKGAAKKDLNSFGVDARKHGLMTRADVPPPRL